jgi:hypothetical protein
LDTRRAESGCGRERPDQQRLADAGNSLQKNVPFADERNQQLIDDGAVPHDGLCDLVTRAAERVQQLLKRGRIH